MFTGISELGWKRWSDISRVGLGGSPLWLEGSFYHWHNLELVLDNKKTTDF